MVEDPLKMKRALDAQLSSQRRISLKKSMRYQKSLLTEVVQYEEGYYLAVTSFSDSRAARNRAEKNRRDNHNANIMAMGQLVPAVAESPKKVDKISILRLTAAFLRSHYIFGRGKIGFLPPNLGIADLENYIFGNIIKNGFCIVVTTTGKIVHVSPHVQEHLGHTQTEMLGHSLYDFIHPKDRNELTEKLTPDDMPGAVSSSLLLPQITDATNDSSTSSQDTSSSSARSERKPFREQRRYFDLRMLHRTASRREHIQYKWVEISGTLTLAETVKNSKSHSSRSQHRELGSTSNDIIFVGIARLLMKQPITGIPMIDVNKDEYYTRHLVDGRILYCDHRVSMVTGYLAEEVSGLSAFKFMHKDDLWWAMIALHQMYVHAQCGYSCYRLLSKTGEFIYLRSHGYLEIDKDTQTVVSFFCINTLVSEEEGMQLVQEMKEKYSAMESELTLAMLQNKEGTNSLESSSGSPVGDLEDAIQHLVDALPSSVSEICLTSPVLDKQYMQAAEALQHLPPAATQVKQIGVEKLHYYLDMTDKNDRPPKEEPKTSNNKQQAHLNEEQDSPGSSGNMLPIKIEEAETILEDVNSIIGTSNLDIPESIDLLNPETVVDEPILNSILDDTVITDFKSSQYPIKRKHNEEHGMISCNKKHFLDQDLIVKMIFKGEIQFDGSLNEHQLADNAIHEKIMMEHLQLNDSIALQGSQLNVLTQTLKNPALQSKKGSLTQLQAEHKMQKKILETLQQDHYKMQINIKHNIGV
ncbi:PREDICTED: hypoxia-inducible factor 3-alpha-like [Dufourea novaeangliae]|uniref:hypoxia-inducible factor 3-alpha-like n=1 Tax=Dufourea novaeangliae TaxID=178035 RepID=UPI000766F8A2|nr:PREDICTED: hypoxia-inducible factor 3-alpha-like [Dufourea novaeangliae]